MLQRTRNLWVGAIGVVVLLLVVGLLLLRVASHGEPGTATPWDRYTAEGDLLLIDYAGTPCDRTGKVVVDEQGERRVVVTVYRRASDQVCVASAVLHHARARLDAPLGTRQVYDGACLTRTGATDDPTCLRTAG